MLHQSKHALRRLTPPTPYAAGMVATAIFEHTFDRAFTAASDKLEIGSIPAGAQVIAATALTENLSAGTTADIGTLTGDEGEDDDTRVLTADLLFDGLDVAGAATENAAPMADCLAITPSDKHRGLGVTLNQNQGVGDKIKVVLQYTY